MVEKRDNQDLLADELQLANMKDDTATLTSAGVVTNSVITLNGEKVDVSRKSWIKERECAKTKYCLNRNLLSNKQHQATQKNMD